MHPRRRPVVLPRPAGGPPALDAVRSTAPPPSPGVPDPKLFPHRAWAAATRAALQRLSDRDLGYPDPSGHPRLRAVLAEWLGRTRGVAAEPDQIHVTTGVSQSLVLLAQALGQSVWAVEDPGSTGAAYVLSQTVTCRRVPIDEHGLVPELIPDDAGAVLSTPSHQYPTGVLMPAERRRRLVDDCRERGRWLIEDDYDSHLAEPGVVPASVQALAPDIVIHVDSLSKLLAPGVRIGWIVAPAPVADRLRAVRLQTDLGGSVLTQLTVSELIASGALDRHLREARREYARRRMRLAADLAPEWSLAGAPVGVHAFVPTAEPDPLVARFAAAEVPALAVAHGEWPGVVVSVAAYR